VELVELENLQELKIIRRYWSFKYMRNKSFAPGILPTAHESSHPAKRHKPHKPGDLHFCKVAKGSGPLEPEHGMAGLIVGNASLTVTHWLSQ
jgi:hypothetical protein